MMISPQPTPVELPLPSIADIEMAHAQLAPYIVATPCVSINLPNLPGELLVKMEIWQRAGSFKIRGALYSLMQLSEQERARGVITASAGNHALALCIAAQCIPTSVKVLMPNSTDQERIARCQALGAEVVLVPTFGELFELLEVLQVAEQRVLVHPFDGVSITTGTATLGLEIVRAAPDLEAVVVAVGGGGLMSGVSYVIKTLLPQCKVYGVEPNGAATLSHSFSQQQPLALDAINTIAKSLSAPAAKPFSYAVCSQYVDGMVTVSDEAIVNAMRVLFNEAALAVEPAAATPLAGILGPLYSELQGKKILMIACGSNMSYPEFTSYLD